MMTWIKLKRMESKVGSKYNAHSSRELVCRYELSSLMYGVTGEEGLMVWGAAEGLSVLR